MALSCIISETYWSEIVTFAYHPCIRRPRYGVLVGILLSRLVWLPDGGKTLMMCLAVSTEYRRVTSCHGIICAMHTRRAVKNRRHLQRYMNTGKHELAWVSITFTNYYLFSRYVQLTIYRAEAITVPHWSWYTGRRWVGCYIWYNEEGSGRTAAQPSPLLAVPNVTAHPSTAGVPIAALLYNGNGCAVLMCPLKS